MSQDFEKISSNSVIFADNVKSISILGNTARIQLEIITGSFFKDGKKTFEKEDSSTVIMPIIALDGLYNILEQLKKQIKDKKEKSNN